jgi:copper(I)-binding protein
MPFRYPLALALAALLFQLGMTGLHAEEPAGTPAADAPAGKLVVKDAWIQLAGDDDLTQAAFARLINHTDTPVRITAVSAHGFRLGMIHRVVLQDGIPRLSMVSTLTIPPGETLQLDKKNYRFIFLGPRKTYKEGDKITVKLQFKDREPERVVFVVSARAPKPGAPASTARK